MLRIKTQLGLDCAIAVSEPPLVSGGNATPASRRFAVDRRRRVVDFIASLHFLGYNDTSKVNIKFRDAIPDSCGAAVIRRSPMMPTSRVVRLNLVDSIQIHACEIQVRSDDFCSTSPSSLRAESSGLPSYSAAGSRLPK